MSLSRAAIITALLIGSATPLLAAKAMSDREMLRAEAEHVCYDDAQKLCPDAMPDEGKVEACMKAKRAQLSPGCNKIFDKGSKL